MKKKQFLACMIAMAMVAASAVAFVPKGEVEAAGLTQAASAEQVNYGSLTEDDEAVLKTLFDFEYYKAQNPDLVSIIGDDYYKLFEHFCKCGIFEGRTCNDYFDPSAYASAYSDLSSVYGKDIIKYYKHYAAVGAKENRTLTTVAACAEAGITVESVAASDVKITPVAYKLAVALGTNDFGTIQTQLDYAAAKAAESGMTDIIVTVEKDDATASEEAESTNSGTNSKSDVIAAAEDKAKEDAAKALERIADLKKVSTVSVKDGNGKFVRIKLWAAKGLTGYAAYKLVESDNGTYSTEEIYKTNDYTTSEGKAYEEQIAYIYTFNMAVVSAPSTEEKNAPASIYTEGEPAYRADASNPTSGISYVMYGGGSGQTKTEDYSTCEVTPVFNLVGTYDADGYVDEFESTAERDAFIQSYNQASNLNKTNGRPVAAAETRDPYYLDAKGDENTVYDISIAITENEDNSVDVSFGVSNDENGYAHVRTYNYKDSSANTTNTDDTTSSDTTGE